MGYRHSVAITSFVQGIHIEKKAPSTARHLPHLALYIAVLIGGLTFLHMGRPVDQFHCVRSDQVALQACCGIRASGILVAHFCMIAIIVGAVMAAGRGRIVVKEDKISHLRKATSFHFRKVTKR